MSVDTEPTDGLDTPTRAIVKRHLRRYREYRERVDTLPEEMRKTLDPTMVRMSHIGSTRGKPSMPTPQAVEQRERLQRRGDEAWFYVCAIETVLAGCDRSEESILRLVYFGDDSGERVTLTVVARMIDVSYTTAQRWNRDLLRRMADAMGLA